MCDSFISRNTERIRIRAPNQYGGCAACEAFEDVGAPTNSTIDEHGSSSIDAFDDPWQCFDCRHYGIQISRAVVGDDKPVDLVLNCQLCIFRMKNAL